MSEDFIKFSCEDCGFRVKTLLKNAGKKGRCPNCKASCIIPSSEKTSLSLKDIEKDLEELDIKWM